MKIVAVRHGEVELNAQEKLSGWLDGPLNEVGRRQAAEVGSQLAGRSFRAIACSTLQRTRQTAAIIAARREPERQPLPRTRLASVCEGENTPGKPCPIHFFDELRERNFGQLNGRSWEEAEAFAGRPLREIDTVQMQYDYRPWGGESVDDVRQRVQHFLSAAPSLAGGADELLVVTHGGIIRMLYSLLVSQEPRKRVFNCSVHVFDCGQVAEAGA